MTRRRAPQLIVSLPWLVAAAMVWYVWPRTPQVPGAGSIIVTPYPVVLAWGFGALAAAWCMSVVFLLYQVAIRRNLGWSLAACVTVLLVQVAGFGSFLARGLTGWRDVSHLRASSGRMYHAQHQWESDALTEGLDRGLLFLRTRVIGVNDNERGYHAIVRPSGLKQYDLVTATSPGHPDSGRLAQSRDGRWVIYLCAWQGYPKPKKGCATSLVYDQNARAFYGDENLKEVSPFLLVEPDDRLNGNDLEALLCTRESPGQEYIRGDTDVRVLCREGTNPNREVRMAAARMLAQIYLWNDGDVALALQVLGRMSKDDVDPGVRQAAHEARADLTRLVAGRSG